MRSFKITLCYDGLAYHGWQWQDGQPTIQEAIDFEELLKQIDRMRWTPAAGKQTILVVDDEASIRQVLRQSLENAGHLVIEAGDGLEGLRIAREQRPNLIILDIMMPNLNGFDVAASLKNDPDFMGIPILMLTVVDDAQRAYGLGVERYLSKPFEPQEIVNEIEELIRKRSEPGSVLVLGELGERQSKLHAAVVAIGHTLQVASDVESLTALADTHPPSLVILCGEEYQETGAVDRIHAALGSRATLTRTLKPES